MNRIYILYFLLFACGPESPEGTEQTSTSEEPPKLIVMVQTDTIDYGGDIWAKYIVADTSINSKLKSPVRYLFKDRKVLKLDEDTAQVRFFVSIDSNITSYEKREWSCSAILEWKSGKVDTITKTLPYWVTTPTKSGLWDGAVHNGICEGRWVKYETKKRKNLVLITHYKNGKKNGTDSLFNRTYFGSQNTLKETYTYVDGVKNGEYIQYHDSGRISASGWYKNGKRNGTFKSYWSSGKPHLEIEYLDDVEISKTEFEYK